MMTEQQKAWQREHLERQELLVKMVDDGVIDEGLAEIIDDIDNRYQKKVVCGELGQEKEV